MSYESDVTLGSLALSLQDESQTDIQVALNELRLRQYERLEAHNKGAMLLHRRFKESIGGMVQAERETVSQSPVEPADRSAQLGDDSSLIEGIWPLDDRLRQPLAEPAAPTMGEFVHVVTDLLGQGGLAAQLLSDGVHLFGKVSWEGDDLLQISCGATSHYVLTPERIPDSPTNRYRSSPPAEFFGRVLGLAGPYHPILAADDKWCNCFRVLRQTIWQLIGGTWRMLGERFHHETLIRIENEVGGAIRWFEFQGFTPMPVLEFGIADRRVPIWVQLEARLDVQLERNAQIRLSPEVSPADSVVFRTFGWWVRPA
jgi:hypothetical protein